MRPCLEDYGTYARVMASSPLAEEIVKYPLLVSFVGQTSEQSAILSSNQQLTVIKL